MIYYDVRCPKCGWEGSTEDCGGGMPIADTGDYDDPTCPTCHEYVEER